MQLKIVNPLRVELDQANVDYVYADTPQGSVGILPHHAPLFTDLSDRGFIRYDVSGERRGLPISGGVLHVLFDKITVMTQAHDAERST